MKSQAKGIEQYRQCAGLFRLGRDVEAALNMVDLFDEAQRLWIRAAIHRVVRSTPTS